MDVSPERLRLEVTGEFRSPQDIEDLVIYGRTDGASFDLDDIRDHTTRSMLLQTFGTLNIRDIVGERRPPSDPASQPSSEPAGELADPMARRLNDLRSRDLERVGAALKGKLPASLVPDAGGDLSERSLALPTGAG